MKITLFILTLFLINPILTKAQLHISGGHSHNDYHQQHPLNEALQNQLVSIEADIFIVDNQLLVGHDTSELSSNKTLDKLYLSPLWNSYQQNKLDTIILLIDIKQQGEACYKLLKKQLQKYDAMLTHYNSHNLTKNHVSIILSGDRPWSLLNEENRIAALDGRMDSISFNLPYSYFPLISDNWNNYFTPEEASNLSSENKAILKYMVSKCHHQHKLIRFWGLPTETKQAQPYWELQKTYGVDLLGTDKPSAFKLFYTSN